MDVRVAVIYYYYFGKIRTLSDKIVKKFKYGETFLYALNSPLARKVSVKDVALLTLLRKL
jgi:hypothetical protein